MQNLSEQQLRELIKEGETSSVEFKIASPRPSELAERLTGLANAQGGYLIIGVEDATLQLAGVTNPRATIDSLLRAARQIVPPLEFSPPEPEIYTLDGKKLVVARVLATAGPIYQASGVFWVRRGTHTVPLSVHEVMEIAHTRGLVRWELLPVDEASLEDLDLDKVQKYLDRRESVRQRDSSRRFDSLEKALVALKCAVIRKEADGSERLVPTNAGILFFGYDPQIYIPQSEIACVLLNDELGMGGYLDRKIVGGTIQELIDGCMTFLNKHLQVGGKVVGWKRTDYPTYATEALREALVNAIIHRDYSRYGERSRIFFYLNRIEIHSPGLLLPGITVEQMEQGEVVSRLRNQTLAFLLGGIPGYIEQLGSGVRFMINETARLELPRPLFQEREEFLVTFRKGQVEETLPEPTAPARPAAISPVVTEVEPHPITLPPGEKPRDVEQRLMLAMRYVQEHGYITTQAYRELVEVAERTALRDLDTLVERGALRRLGKTRSRRYLLP